MHILLLLCAQLALADSLYAHGYYDAARVEYLRCFFFYPQMEHEMQPRLRYAISVLDDDETNGVALLNGIVNDFPDLPDKVKNEIAIKYMETGRYYLAVDLLEGGKEKNLLGLAFLLDGQFLNARSTFLRGGNYELAAKIDEFLKHPTKSEKTALLLSLFLPGSGQVYAGDLHRGIMDFLVNAGSGYLFYNALRQHKYVDASLIFFFLVNRFYLGSLNNALKSAFQYNEKQRKAWLDAFLQAHFDSLNPTID
jgi:hypothetical protein